MQTFKCLIEAGGSLCALQYSDEPDQRLYSVQAVKQPAEVCLVFGFWLGK